MSSEDQPCKEDALLYETALVFADNIPHAFSDTHLIGGLPALLRKDDGDLAPREHAPVHLVLRVRSIDRIIELDEAKATRLPGQQKEFADVPKSWRRVYLDQ